MTGAANNLNINLIIGDGRFEVESLVAQDVSIVQRSTNDILVNPQQSLLGSILSTGNVISFNQPPIVDVEETFTGRLIFN